jgi:DtxR family Mn-dependent transcriptional regulator
VNAQLLEPLQSLAIAAIFGLLAFLVLRPGQGYLWRWLRARKATERALIEDALKHLFDCEYKGKTASLESLAGVLSSTGGQAAEIVGHLQERELVTSSEHGYRLTDTGRRYALRVVRIHRLWERYLSDHTGLEPEAWHDEAELREHETTPEEAESLSARLGHPRYDPHGDPIPTAGGEIAAPEGKPLTALPVGELAEIVHVEDEPSAVYAQLVAEGLVPGMRIRIIEKSPRRIRFEADAEEYVLAPIVAANLSVLLLPRDEQMDGPFESLATLEIGESATVVGFAPGLRGPGRRRMLDLGLIPGTRVAVELRSPAGDPTGYRIRGAVIALRREQAEQIKISRSQAPAMHSEQAAAS